jgi:putative hydrolase of the HAD superfamily
MLETIAFDADDTLWQNETLYTAAKEKFVQILASYPQGESSEHRLNLAETRNVSVYGYGIKSFLLSMLETALDLTGNEIQGSDLRQILDLGKEMLSAEVRLFDHVEQTLALLSQTYPLMAITKGDLVDQQSKFDRSGIARYFKHIEIVSDKTRHSYEGILARHNLQPAHFLMVGNSLRSDILPVLALGAWAVYIPYAMTWAHENEIDPQHHNTDYFELEHIGLLPEFIEKQVWQ